jgi:hypothetical protein
MPGLFALSINPDRYKADVVEDLFWGTFHHQPQIDPPAATLHRRGRRAVIDEPAANRFAAVGAGVIDKKNVERCAAGLVEQRGDAAADHIGFVARGYDHRDAAGRLRRCRRRRPQPAHPPERASSEHQVGPNDQGNESGENREGLTPEAARHKALLLPAYPRSATRARMICCCAPCSNGWRSNGPSRNPAIPNAAPLSGLFVRLPRQANSRHQRPKKT